MNVEWQELKKWIAEELNGRSFSMPTYYLYLVQERMKILEDKKYTEDLRRAGY